MDDIRAVLDDYSLGDFPSGLGGCRSTAGARGGPHPCCEYNVSVFDERAELDTVVAPPAGGAAEAAAAAPAYVIHHCSLSETPLERPGAH